MEITLSEVQDFVHSLRMKCNATQILQFSPPNESNEVFRAMIGEHMIFACLTELGVRIVADPLIDAQLLELWKARKAARENG